MWLTVKKCPTVKCLSYDWIFFLMLLLNDMEDGRTLISLHFVEVCLGLCN